MERFTATAFFYSLAHQLNDQLRPTDVIARYGGDEFIIILPKNKFNNARHIADRLHREMM